MAEPQTLEEAFEELFATAARIPLASPAEFQSAARALALAVLEECFPDAITDGTDWQRGSHAIIQPLRRRIEELGR